MTSKQKLYDNFFKEQIELSPSMNDSLNFSRFSYWTETRKPFSDEYRYFEKELLKKYLQK